MAGANARSAHQWSGIDGGRCWAGGAQDGETPLSIARREGHAELVLLLLTAGATGEQEEEEGDVSSSEEQEDDSPVGSDEDD